MFRQTKTLIAITTMAGFAAAGCGSKEANPTVTVQFGSFSEQSALLEWLIPSAYASVAEAKLCFKRLRFKTLDKNLDGVVDPDDGSGTGSGDDTTDGGSGTDEEFDDIIGTARTSLDDSRTGMTMHEDSVNVDFTPGEVTLSPSGTTLGDITLPAATYRRVEFFLSSKCASGKSVQVRNDSGSFSIHNAVKIRFDGVFEASESGQVLSLRIADIMSALDKADSDASIKSHLHDANVKGSF